MSLSWNSLQSIAEQEVQSVMASLPEDLRKEAKDLPVIYDARRDEELHALDLNDTLGLFVGRSMRDGDHESQALAPQIILFPVNIWRFAEHDEQVYREEVRTTYLHELGHYLGLEEIDLEERGL